MRENPLLRYAMSQKMADSTEVAQAVNHLAETLGISREHLAETLYGQYGFETLNPETSERDTSESAQTVTQDLTTTKTDDKEGDDTPDETDENTDETGGTPEDTDEYEPKTWNVNGEELEYNDLQTVISESEMDYPENCDGDSLAKALKQAAEGPEESETDENEGDANNEPRTWVVNGEELDYNGLQTAVSNSDMSYPENRNGDNLAEMLNQGAKAPETTEDGQSETDDEDTTETTEQPSQGVMSEESLLEAGIDKGQIEKIQKYQRKNGICTHSECVYGANQDSDYCASHESSKGQNGSTGGSNGQSNADKVQEVKAHFEEVETSIQAEAVVYQVSKGEYDSISEAVKNHL